MLSLIWVAKGKAMKWFHCEPTTVRLHGVSCPQDEGLVMHPGLEQGSADSEFSNYSYSLHF